MRLTDRFLDHPFRTAVLLSILAAIPCPAFWTITRVLNCTSETWLTGLRILLLVAGPATIIGAGLTLLLTVLFRSASTRSTPGEPSPYERARAARNGALLGAALTVFVSGFCSIGVAIGDCMVT